jgi:hypothetical protein
MAIFRKPKGGPPAADEPARPSPPRPRGPGLADQLQAIAASGPAEEVLEPALHAIVAYAGAHAAALCLYDQRHGILRLASEVGLSDEGCKRLRTVRRGDPTSWEMPLHGLVNRRAYLIESAARNRYVPRLVDASTVRTVACIPLYAGIEAVGSLVLIAVAPRSFGERDVEALWTPLRTLATMIVATRQHTRVEPQPATPRVSTAEVAALTGERDRLLVDLAARVAERDRLAAELTERTSELDRLRAALDTAAAERVSLSAELKRMRIEAARVGRLTSALAEAEGERERLAAGLEQAAATHAEEVRRAAALERARTEAEAGARALAAELAEARRTTTERLAEADRVIAERQDAIAGLEARLAVAEAALVQERARAEEQEREAQRLSAELQAAGVRELRLREELSTADARQAAEGEADLSAARAAARAAEESRAVAAAELERVRADAEMAHALAKSLEDALSKEREAHARVTVAEQTLGSERDRLTRALEEARSTAAASAARLEPLERDGARLVSEHQRLAERLREQEAAHVALEAHLEAVAAERDRLRDSLEAAQAAQASLRSEGSAASSTLARLEGALAREGTERARLADAFAQAQTTLVAFEHAQAQQQHEATERAAELATVRAELSQVRAERDDALARLAEAETVPPVVVQPLSAPLADVEPEPAPAPEPQPQIESVPVQVVSVARVSHLRDAAAAGPRIAVLDAGEAWAQAEVPGYEVVVVAPDAGAPAAVAQCAPNRLLLNLTAPGALPALAALRTAGTSAPVWACIADVDAGRGLALGLVEPAVHPIDPDAIVALLGPRLARGSRVVTAGADVDALMSLRQALARKGMSVSMAWDAKQATELLGVVRPHAVVVDLDLTRRDGYAIVARLATLCAVAHVVLVGGNADAPKAFLATLNDPSVAPSIRPLAQILADVVARDEAPAAASGGTVASVADRRARIRAVGTQS